MMKTFNILPTFVLMACIALFTGCEDKHTQTYTANVPVYKSFEDWRATEINIQDPQEVSDAGKIYIYGSYLLVNDRFKGLHIYDNSDPSSPTSIGFLPIHGNVNMAIRNDRLYVDSYTDLLTFDISDINSPRMTCRVEDVFNFTAHSNLDGYDENLPIGEYADANKVVVGWEQEEVTTEEHGGYYSNERAFGGVTVDMAVNEGPPMAGTGGSMAQFTLTGKYLYTLEPNELTAFDLSNADCPAGREEVRINRTAETIFPYNDHLFLGTTTGMMIYSLKNNPTNPQLVSEFDHVTACDPVVVQGNKAYVTIRTGNTCWGNVNELIVLDISDYSNPYEITSYGMTNPHGLGIDGSTLFICDGAAGLKVYDASNVHEINNNMLGHFEDINTYDVIPYNNVLITSAEEGIYQYDYSDPSDLKQLSIIATGE